MKAVRELESEQRTHQTLVLNNSLNIATFCGDAIMVQAGNRDALINNELVAKINAAIAKAKLQNTIKNSMRSCKLTPILATKQPHC